MGRAGTANVFIRRLPPGLTTFRPCPRQICEIGTLSAGDAFQTDINIDRQSVPGSSALLRWVRHQVPVPVILVSSAVVGRVK